MTKTPIAVLGIDLGKNSCSVAGLDVTGAVVLRRRMTREGVVAFAAALPSCTSPWRHAAEPTTWAAPWPAKVTRSD